MFRKTTIALCLLSSLLLLAVGCNPVTNGQEPDQNVTPAPQPAEEFTVDDRPPPPPPLVPERDTEVNQNTVEEPTVNDDDALSPDTDKTPLQPVLGSAEFTPPNPLSDPPPPMMGVKSTPRTDRSPKVYINLYYFSENALSMRERAKVKAWANKRGLTAAEANEQNFAMAVVRFVDWRRDKPTRNIVYDGNAGPLLPTTVMVDYRGTDLRHEIGDVNIHDLDFWYDAYSHKNSNKRLSEGRVAANVAESRVMPADTPPLPPADQANSESGDWTCKNGRCYPNWSKGKKVR